MGIGQHLRPTGALQSLQWPLRDQVAADQLKRSWAPPAANSCLPRPCAFRMPAKTRWHGERGAAAARPSCDAIRSATTSRAALHESRRTLFGATAAWPDVQEIDAILDDADDFLLLQFRERPGQRFGRLSL